jgi:hypothetical protein
METNFKGLESVGRAYYDKLNTTAKNTIKENDMKNLQNVSNALLSFVNQRPGFDFANYGRDGVKYYRADMREATNDRADFLELYSFAAAKLGTDIQGAILSELDKGGRLCLVCGSIEYHTGQYFPTEYRAAACRLMANILWAYVRSNYAFGTGDEIRKYFRRNFSRRICKNYFN